jgi:hypothetical protein
VRSASAFPAWTTPSNTTRDSGSTTEYHAWNGVYRSRSGLAHSHVTKNDDHIYRPWRDSVLFVRIHPPINRWAIFFRPPGCLFGR